MYPKVIILLLSRERKIKWNNGLGIMRLLLVSYDAFGGVELSQVRSFYFSLV